MIRREPEQNPRAPKPHNPLEKRRLAEGIVRELLASQSEQLGALVPFLGAGVYLIFYRGEFPLYAPLARANRRTLQYPIYVGQAVSSGSRKGKAFSDAVDSPALFNRLNQHANSVRAARNLDIADFDCRFLVVEEFWITLAESLLIESYRPLWNIVLDGFGNHDPGAGRRQGRRPNWDTLHPGRAWADRLQPGLVGLAEIEARVSSHLLETNYP